MLFGALGGTFALGVLVGLSGIGGFLLPPWLHLTLGLPPSQAVPITLLSFTISSLVASTLYARDRAIDFRLAAALAASALPGVCVGLLVGTYLSPRTWSHLIGFTLIAAAVWLLRPAVEVSRATSTAARSWVVGVGFLAGVFAVVAGVTGPLIMLPGLRVAGVSSATAVGTSLLASVGVSLAAVAGYGALRGAPHQLALYIVPVVVIGTVAGAIAHRRTSAPTVGGLIRLLCAAAGVWMLLR